MATKIAFILFLLVLIAPAASGQGGLICGFMAIYGGTEEQARALLQKVKRRFPQANIRKMRVLLDFADQ